jgi:hypothetical protein
VLYTALREVPGEPATREVDGVPDVGENEHVLGEFAGRMEALAFTKVLDEHDIPYRLRSEPGGDPLFRRTAVLVEPERREECELMLAEWRGSGSG